MIRWIRMVFCKHDFWLKFLPEDGSYTKFLWDDYATSENWYCIKCDKVSYKTHFPTEEEQNEKIINALSKSDQKGNINLVKDFLTKLNKEVKPQ